MRPARSRAQIGQATFSGGPGREQTVDSRTRNTGALASTVRRIETGITEGRWRANERLPSERALAEAFGVSRATIREAIARLASKGLLETRRGSGVYLLGAKPAALAAPWLQLISETPPLRTETLEFRLVFECAAARFAAQRSSQRELEKFEAILERMHAAVRDADVDEEAATDGEFHATLTAASHNRLLDQFYASVITMLREHIASNTYDATVNNANAAIQARDRLHQHEGIYRAIRDRDPDAAQQAMFVHIDYVGRQFNV
ncbi:FadR family transcriptional regulator [Burkholderia plantarii]|nr:FadR family transcriptional regulator [Burkholderia plantarii]